MLVGVGEASFISRAAPFIDDNALVTRLWHDTGVAMDLLHQSEDILEYDALIDELGFIHPSQFALLKEELDIRTCL
ncbi:hypothetical protein CR513_31818, partial [Mucuna pruriens]